MHRNKKSIREIDSIFNARSIAVVGASNDLRKFGGMTLETIVRGGYSGHIYPVNPKEDQVQGLKAYPSIAHIPERLDAVIVIVPAHLVSGVVAQAAMKGAKGAIILSAGFREAGREDLEEELLSVARKHAFRLLGPNIQGINYLKNKLCAMFFPVIDTKGPMAVISESGSITTVLCEWAADEGFGISAAINLGNQLDLCESDYIDFLAQDDSTEVIAMYLESVKDGRRFAESLKRACTEKPVVLLKAGRTEGGARLPYWIPCRQSQDIFSSLPTVRCGRCFGSGNPFRLCQGPFNPDRSEGPEGGFHFNFRRGKQHCHG